MKNKNNFLRGFTVIELIVVIAIIAILSTIVSASLMTYVSKSKNAAIKANMASLQTYGGLYITEEGIDDYTNFFNEDKSINIINEIIRVSGSSVTKGTDGDNWCAETYLIPLLGEDKGDLPVFCVDSSGLKKEGRIADLTCVVANDWLCH
jgi:prepilin-type N-terminal cleavage/methylation domain-containing protein